MAPLNDISVNSPRSIEEVMDKAAKKYSSSFIKSWKKENPSLYSFLKDLGFDDLDFDFDKKESEEYLSTSVEVVKKSESGSLSLQIQVLFSFKPQNIRQVFVDVCFDFTYFDLCDREQNVYDEIGFEVTPDKLESLLTSLMNISVEDREHIILVPQITNLSKELFDEFYFEFPNSIPACVREKE